MSWLTMPKLDLWSRVPAMGVAPGTWLPTAGGKLPTLFADFTTESTNGHFWFNGAFANTAALMTALSGSITTSNGSFFNSSGNLAFATTNQPRIDFNPLTLACRGILIEGSNINIALQSNQFDTTWSTSLASVASAATTSPDGTTNGWNLTNGGNAYGSIFQSIAINNGSTYTMSFFAKANSINTVTGELRYLGSTYDFKFTLTGSGTATINGLATGAPTATITQLPNGWYRCTVTKLSNAVTAVIIIGFGDTLHSGDTVFIYGAQLELNTFASSYIKTTTGSVTRGTDSLTGAYASLSSGTMLAVADTINVSAARDILQIDDGTENNRATLLFNATPLCEFDVFNGGVSQTARTSTAVTANTAFKVGAAFASNDFALVVNNGAASTSAAGAIGGVNAIRFGASSAAGINLYGHISSLAVWNNVRASNAELGRLTT